LSVDYVDTKVNDAINAQALDPYVPDSNIIQQRFVVTTPTSVVPSAHTIDNDVCNVYVNGVYQDKSTYAINEAGNVITFLETLDVDDVINIHSSDVSLSVDPDAFVLDLIKAVPTLYTFDVATWIARGDYTSGTNTLDLANFLPFVVGEPSPYNSITVFLNGVLQAPNYGYTIGGTYGNNEIIFQTSLNNEYVLGVIVGQILPVPTISTTLSKASGSWVVGTDPGITAGTALLSLSPIAYVPGERQLMVYLDGVYQSLTGGAYTETSTTSITFASAISAGTIIDVFKIV
jgi:hypothetical protein